MKAVEFSIADDHPALDGHFPGKPVAPGVVLLNALFKALQQQDASCCVETLRQVKFIRPVLPGQPIRVQLQIAPSGIKFIARHRDEVVFSGELGAP